MALPSIELAELADRVTALLRHCTEEEADTVVRVAMGNLRREKLGIHFLPNPPKEPDE